MNLSTYDNHSRQTANIWQPFRRYTKHPPMRVISKKSTGPIDCQNTHSKKLNHKRQLMQTYLATQQTGTEPSSGGEMLTQLQLDLCKLTPSLRRVAQYCIAHSHGLHRMGIQEVAEASQTIPAAVVRLAQRYGIKGFRELKLAFLPPTQVHETGTTTAPSGRSDVQHTAITCIENMAANITQIQSEIMRPEFSWAVNALREAERIVVTRPADSQAYLHRRLIQGLGATSVVTRCLGEETPLAGDLWIVLPAEKAPPSCRGNRAYRQIATNPNALHFIGFKSTGFTVACELIASFRAVGIRQDPLKIIAFCDALGSVVTH